MVIWLLKDWVSGEQAKKITRKFNYASCLEYHPHWARPFNTVFAKAKLFVFKYYGNEFERVYVMLQLRAVIIPWSVT